MLKRQAKIIMAGFLVTSPAAAADELPDALNAGWKGEKVCELMHEDEHIRVLRCTFRAGQGHERHYHPPHFGYALSGGTARIVDSEGARESSVPTGWTWTSDGVAWHTAENIGDTTQRYLIIEKKYQPD